MVANPYAKSKIVCTSFPQLSLANCKLSFVSQSKYLGHIIENTFCDDNDINRKIKSLLLERMFLSDAFYIAQDKLN